MEREEYLKEMLKFFNKDRNLYKRMINKLEKELKEIERTRNESRRVS